MRNIIKIIALIGISILFFPGCQNPMEDFTLGFKDPIEKSRLEIRASNASGTLPELIEVIFAGDDGDKIVTVLNTKKFKINKEGNLFVAVDPLITPSSAEPVKFSLASEPEGFTKIVREFTFAGTGNQSYALRLFSKSSPPKGVSASQFEVNEGTTTQFKTTGPDKKEELIIDIPSGTRFLNNENKPVNGKIDLVAHHFDNRNARSFLPAGGLASNALDQAGKPLSDPFDLPQYAGFANILASSDQHEQARTLSVPISLTFELNPETINYETKAKIKEGDVIPLLSFDDYKNQWKIEGTAKVEKSGSKLIAKASVSKLVYWIIGWPRTLCRQGPRFTLKSNFTDVDLSYLVQVIGVTSGKVLRTTYVSFNNQTSFSINNFPKDTEKIKIKVFNFNNIYGGDQKTALYDSPPMEVCENKNNEINVSSVPVPPFVTVTYKVACEQGKILDESTLPAETRTQFTESGKEQWRDLVVVTRKQRSAKSYKLQVGKTYDLKASIDGGASWPYKQNKFLVNKKTWFFEFSDLNNCK